MSWTKEVLGTEKPIIAMCHIRPLPSDPYFNEELGMEWVAEKAREEFLALQKGGVDAVMFSNEFSMPYLKKVRPATTVAMGRIIGELLRDIEIPFGVNMLWDPYATLDLAAATGACFVREVMSGVYASDLGLWNLDTGDIVRYHRSLGLKDKVKLLFNIYPEAAVYLAERDIADIARSTNFNDKPDAILVSGLTAGADTDTQVIVKVKKAVPNTLVFCNTGCKPETIEAQLSVADGAVVGTTFKKDGLFDNHVEYERVVKFMDVVHSFRK